jgi:pimeloyl-ACP methyl ester carboxylesterase
MLWDGPAHGENPEARTHMVEFGLALRDDLESLKTGVEVLVAHSFGGGASAWAVSKGLQVANLFVIGTPVSIEGVLHRFEKRLRLHPKASHAFRKQMEHLTGLTVNKISLTHYYPTLSMKTRVTQIHDRLDKEVPYAEIAEFQKKYPDANIFETEGLGHRRILLSDKVISEVLRRLSKKVL